MILAFELHAIYVRRSRLLLYLVYDSENSTIRHPLDTQPLEAHIFQIAVNGLPLL